MRPALNKTAVRPFIAISLLGIALALPAAAQYGGPPTTTTVGGHFLAPAPSATSTAARHTPNALPSVTSIPNYGYHYGYGPYYNGYHGGHGYRNGGWAYAVPYYYPVDNSAYSYDYVGGAGPDLYSGPPVGPNDPGLHVLVEQPPARPYSEDEPYPQAYAPAPPPEPPAPPPADVKPGDPTVLVFRNGKQQEVTNYAIMGDSLYVFDQARKKIALADLDLPATVKANDDRGVEFNLPPGATRKTTTAPAPLSTAPNSRPTPDSTPDTTTSAPPNVAAVMP
ncbi:MAG: hypothetical protein WAL85_08525 [Candidatus Korobacteraceae bacterium]